MEIKTNTYQTPFLVEVHLAHADILCASLSGPQLDNMTEENDDNPWSDIY